MTESKNTPCLMEPEGSLPSSQDPATGPHPESEHPVHYSPPYFSDFHTGKKVKLSLCLTKQHMKAY
jgi:hypothetical protein